VDTNLVTAVRPVHQNCSPLARDCLACHLRQVWLLTRPWLPPLQGRDDIHTTSLLGLLAAALGRLVCERAQAAGQSAVRVGCPARGRVCLLARWPSCRQLLEQQLHASCDGLPGAHQLVRVLGRVQACAARPSLCSRPGSLRCPTRHASAPRQPAPARQQPHAGCGSLPPGALPAPPHPGGASGPAACSGNAPCNPCAKQCQADERLACQVQRACSSWHHCLLCHAQRPAAHREQHCISRSVA